MTPNKKTRRSNSEVNSTQYCQQSGPTVRSRAEGLATAARPPQELTCVPTVQPRPSRRRPRAGPQCRLACSGAEVFRQKTNIAGGSRRMLERISISGDQGRSHRTDVRTGCGFCVAGSLSFSHSSKKVVGSKSRHTTPLLLTTHAEWIGLSQN